jgi:transposase
VKDFAQVHDRLAKTDKKLEAKILAMYSEKIDPKDNVDTDEKEEEISDLIARRDQLVSMIGAEKNRLYQAPQEIRKSIKTILEALKAELKVVEIDLKKLFQKIKNYT